MRKALPSTFENEMTRDLHDPRNLENHVRATYGMSSAQMQTALEALISVSRGETPSPAAMKTIVSTAKQKYGWNEQRTRAELSKALQGADAETRIARYLSGNGAEKVDGNYYRHAVELTSHAARADLEASLHERLDARQNNNAPRDTFNGMRASENTLRDSRNEQDRRNLLNIQLGNLKPKNYSDKVAQVTLSKHRLADRIENNAEKHRREGTEPSLKETLRDNFDLRVVSDYSADLGLGSPVDEANEHYEAATSHLEDSFDVTENLD